MQNLSSITKFWRVVELFEPQQIPKLAPNDEAEPVVKPDYDDALPWEIPTQKGINQKERTFYQIYGGVFKMNRLKEAFGEFFGGDEDAPDFGGRNNNESAVFTFTVNGKGQPLIETFALASCAWALGQISQLGRDSEEWLKGFESAQTEMTDKFAERMANLARSQKGEISAGKNDSEISSESNESKTSLPVLTFAALLDESRWILKKLGIENVFEPVELRIKSFQKSNDSSAAEQPNFLNSFYVKDLELVSKQIEKGNLGAGLKRYLTAESDLAAIGRIDLRKSVETLFENLSPESFPRGRWAAEDLYPLAFSQQFAVNAIWQNLASGRLFSVNGPPGTGKTTMLRDVIAAVVVNRAEQLANFDKPEKAFYGKAISLSNLKDYHHRIAPVSDKLKNFGIVVASGNNGAVENISLELPVEKAIDTAWRKECEYFSEAATHLINKKEKEGESNENHQIPAWGLIAAKLGNAQNKSDFKDRFWFDAASGKSFKSRLDAAAAEPKDPNDYGWQTAVKEFRAACGEETKLRAKRLAVHRQIMERMRAAAQLQALPQTKAIISAELQKIENFATAKKSEKSKNELEQGKLKREKNLHRENHPNWLSVVFSLGRRLREWNAENDKLQSALVRLNNHLSGFEQDLWKIKAEKDEANKQLFRLAQQETELVAQIEKIDAGLKEAQSYFGDNFPDLDKWRRDEYEKTRELSAPWFDELWNDARIRVFAKALQLHKAFILANAKSIRQNLAAFIDIIKGQIPAIENLPGATDIWATLFLVVPVVSTTFASFDKLFKHLGREEIGWLLVDEAGQAVPQSAVGAIWRSKRIVVVGDPLQLEPISTLPEKMQNALAAKFGVEDVWLPGGTSVQELADRVNSFGTHIKVKDIEIWVGSPLRVHRRCQEPMFSISNKIAYDDLMIYGTKDDEDEVLRKSLWINVENIDMGGGHWIEAEGREAETIIREILNDGCSPKDIYLISPFAKVAKELKRIGRKFGIKNAGTVHTTQGKEASVVILVLGASGAANSGARAWASAKPNLLNVAVSRARKRLYIIGSRNEWKSESYFGNAINFMQS